MRPTHSASDRSHRTAATGPFEANRTNWLPSMLAAATAVKKLAPVRWSRSSLRMAAGRRNVRMSISTQSSGNATRLIANNAAAISPRPSRVAVMETMPVAIPNAKLSPGRSKTSAANADRRGARFNPSRPPSSPAGCRCRSAGEPTPPQVSSAAVRSSPIRAWILRLLGVRALTCLIRLD
jgi:hypothetical protein